MSQKVYDAAYEADLAAYFDRMLPEKVYDAHVHINRGYMTWHGLEGEPFPYYRNFMEKYIGRPIAGGLMMPQPSSKHTKETLRDNNLYNLKVAQEEGFAAGLIITPGCGREQTEAYLDTYDCIRVLKPYLCYTAKDWNNRFEADILDFAPEWMWQLANDREMSIMIHLSHYQNMLSEPANYEQIRYLCEKYPKAKLILAHCAMGHHVRKLRLGLEKIKDIPNIWFDCSGSAETMSIYYCLKAFGVKKMMYGGDFDHAATVGRICSFGSNFIGIHDGYLNESAVPPDYRHQPLNNGQECLLALLEACELLELNKEDLEDIFYNNAKVLFGR